MATSQPTTPRKSSRLFSRFLRWRSSSSSTIQSLATASPTTKTEERDTTVRRTSPVDANLGVTDLAIPGSTQAPRRNGCTKQLPESDAADVVRRQEMAALRDLAAELHNALRRSEEENTALKARLETLDQMGLLHAGEDTCQTLGDVVSDLRHLAAESPTTSSNFSALVKLLKQRQAELRTARGQLLETQTEVVFTEAELQETRRALRRLQQRLVFTEDELAAAKHKLVQASVSRQRLMQELQTTRGLLMRCWARVRALEQQQPIETNQ